MAEQMLNVPRHVLSDDHTMDRLDLALELVVFGRFDAWASPTLLNSVDRWIGSVTHG